MSATNADSSSPYRRDNYWGKTDADEQDTRGHDETQGTDPAAYLAYQHLSQFTDLVCGRTLRAHDREQPLTDPEFYLPKQHDIGHGYIEYRQHRHRRRCNPETGWINWGESTSTAVPEVDEETYMLAVESYLRENGVAVHRLEAWREYAARLYADPQQSSKAALATLIERKRTYDARRQDPHQTAHLPE